MIYYLSMSDLEPKLSVSESFIFGENIVIHLVRSDWPRFEPGILDHESAALPVTPSILLVKC
jgi:hypothetical protein